MINSLRNLIKRDLDPDSQRGRLIREAGWVFIVQASAAVLGLISSVVFARTLGSYNYGLYSSVIAWQGLIGVVVELGLGIYLLKISSQTDPENVPHILGWADRWLLISGLAGATALVLIGIILPFSSEVLLLFVLAAPLPFLGKLVEIRQYVLRGLGRTVFSQWPPLILGPGIVLISLFVWAIFGFNITPATILILSLISMLLILFVFSQRLNASYTKTKKFPELSIRDALPFVLVSTLILLNQRVDIIILGILRPQNEVGLYTVASKGSVIVNYILIVVNTVIGSHLAARYKAGDFQGMQTLLTASIRRAFIITCIPAFAMIFAGTLILGFLFGDEYTAASVPLAILAFAQLLNVGAGSVGMILNMTGGEKVVALGVGFSVILNAALNFILIPLYSINGAAISTGISMVAWNFILVLAVRKRLSLRPTVLGI